MNFHNINLPYFIEAFAIGVSEFSTSSAISMSGREVRSSHTIFPRRKYILQGCKLSNAEFEIFNSFFMARGGKKFSFRLRDPFDFSVTQQTIIIAEGGETQIQLNKKYHDDFAPCIRKITKIKDNSLTLWLNSEKIDTAQIDINSGTITLNEALANGDNLTASFKFDVTVRFSNDNFQYIFNPDGTISLHNVEMIEVME